MKSTLTKQELVDKLTALLPEVEEKQTMIDSAKALIPSSFNQAQLTSIHNSSAIQKAFLAYKSLCPYANESRPSIDLVVAWLLDMGAVSYAAALEKKLAQVNKIAMKFGRISPDDTFTITGIDLLMLRVYSAVDILLTKPDPRSSHKSENT
jgi:hypothetical protein